jgi:hypothetical protein
MQWRVKDVHESDAKDQPCKGVRQTCTCNGCTSVQFLGHGTRAAVTVREPPQAALASCMRFLGHGNSTSGNPGPGHDTG